MSYIRRIDELGRIVIPKDIRSKLRIREGDNLEIKIEDEQIKILKHSLLNKMVDLAQNMTETLHSIIKKNIIITDNNKILAISGNSKSKYLNKEISSYLEKAIKRRENILERHLKNLEITNNEVEVTSYVISTIIVNGDAIGLVIILDKENVSQFDYDVANIVSKFLSKYLE